MGARVPVSWRADLLQDWDANRGNAKARAVLVAFRLAHRCGADPSVPRPVALVVDLAYRLFASWLLGVELPSRTEVGPALRIAHPIGIVVNGDARIGARVLLRCSTTIGNLVTADGESGSPAIGDDVELGANVVVVGPITIGDGARIGAGAVVLRDVPGGAVAVGNPARVLDQPSGAPASP